LTTCRISQTARFNLPGIIAFESAKRGGELLDVPDLGNPPEDWEMLNPDGEYGTNPVVDEIVKKS